MGQESSERTHGALRPNVGVMASTRTTPPKSLGWTGNEQADALIAQDPMALLIGFCLDQQIPVEKAFMGPLVMIERLGTIDAKKLAKMSPAKFEAAFRTVPAIHRFPASMAERVQAMCVFIADEYDGDAARIWTKAADAKDLHKRFVALPGFGKMKAQIMVAVVGKHFGVKPKGWADVIPDWPSLADVTTVEQRKAYQAKKREYKAEMRAAGKKP